DASERLQIIDRTRVRRACATDDHKRRESVLSICRDGVLQRIDANSELPVRGDLADVRVGKTGEIRGFLKGVMHLVGAVERAAHEVIAQPRLPRGNDRRKICERAACRKNATRSGAISDDLAEPADDIRLELHECWSR